MIFLEKEEFSIIASKDSVTFTGDRGSKSTLTEDEFELKKSLEEPKIDTFMHSGRYYSSKYNPKREGIRFLPEDIGLYFFGIPLMHASETSEDVPKLDFNELEMIAQELTPSLEDFRKKHSIEVIEGPGGYLIPIPA